MPSMADNISERSSTVQEETLNTSATTQYLDIPPTDEKVIIDPYLIDAFDEGDPANPKNWSRARRWYLTSLAGMLVLNATFASSAPSGIAAQLMEEYNLSEELVILAISLFVAGYVVGPLLWAPLSEEFGRRPIFIYSFAIYTVFQVAAAVAKNGASLLVFRFIGGVFAAAPLTNSGAIISDIWDSNTRGMAMALYTLAPFAGPSLGPTVGGFIAVSGTNFRWVFWVLTIFAGVCLIAIIFTLPETYTPVLLVKAAIKKRKETGDERYMAPMEKIRLPLGKRAENVLARPFRILFAEPMLLAITMYMSFLYGCIYLLFEVPTRSVLQALALLTVHFPQAYPIVFTVGHHLNAGISGLMFLPTTIGGAVAVFISVVLFNPRYEREAARLAPAPVPPEFRLEMGIYSAPLYAASFFWFGWTSSPSISLWAPMMSGFANGFGTSWLFLSLVNYTVDTYLSVAASALAASTVVRSVFGAAFPLFATQMFKALGAPWASSLLGFIALAMVPIPIILMRFGPLLRGKSKHAPVKPKSKSEVVEA
ncbi:major facilitator superfamily domain-containing protein [Mycena crocata]|nr:major facilitator superfamily domain-containing protein [Mycena crocata]